MNIPKKILKICNDLGLPLEVKSSSLYIFHRLKEHMDDDISHLCVFIGCKSCDIHGCLRRKFSGLKGFNFDGVVKREIEAFGYLDFDFVFPSPFSAVFALRMVCKERGISLESVWEDDVRKVENILVMGAYSPGDVALAVLGIGEDLIERLDLGSEFRYDYEVVKSLCGV